MTQIQPKAYEPPFTTMMTVALEDCLCASADVNNPKGRNGEIDKHNVNTAFGDYEFTDGNDAWDTSF